MNRGILLALAGVFVVLGLLFTTIGSKAQEGTITRTINLNQGVGRIVDEDLNYGDRIVLRLNNPTDQALTFETRYPLVGDTRTWTVPANSARTVEFDFRQVFSDDLTYIVRQEQTREQVAQGVLIPRDRMNAQQGEAAVREAPQDSMTGQQEGQMVDRQEGQVTEQGATVRGFW